MQDNSNQLLFSRKSAWKHCILQAATGSVRSVSEAKSHIQSLKSDAKTSQATEWIIAFRINEENSYEEGDEVGAGEKMVHMIERMGIDNIFAALIVWSDGRVLGNAAHKVMLEKVKDLLLNIHSQVREMYEEPKQNITLPHIDLDSLENSINKELSFSVSMRKPNTISYRPTLTNSMSENNELIEEIELRASSILDEISPTELWNLKGMIHHPVIGKMLSALYCLVYKGLPGPVDLSNMMEDKSLHAKLEDLIEQTIPRKQVLYAMKILRKDIKRLNSVYLSNLSSTSAYLMAYMECVIKILNKKYEESIRTQLPSLSKPSSRSQSFDPKTLRSGNFLALKQMVLNNDNKTAMQVCRKPETPRPDPNLEEPAGIEALQTIAVISKENEMKIQYQPGGIEIGDDFLNEKLRKAREQRLEEEQRINRLLNLNLEDLDFTADLNVKLSEKEVLQYLSTCNIQQESTNVLVHLVQKLKTRRTRRYNF